MWVKICPHLVLLLFSSILTASCTEDKGSLTFVIDNTLSMTDDIDQVKRSTDKITNAVFEERSSQIQNMVLVTFNDPYAVLEGVIEDRESFRRHIHNVYVHNRYGNYDCAEMSMTGISLALRSSRPGSFIYVFTDAAAKDYEKSAEIKNLCQKTQSQIVFVLTGFCYGRHERGFQVFYDIAAACSGITFFVEKKDVDKVVDTLTETIKGKKSPLAVRTVPANQLTNIPFQIDDQTEYAIITASGENVYLTVSGPSCRQVQGMWIPNAKVLKIYDPTPGEYIATVKGNTETAVYIVGRTDFIFSHGFSELEPKVIGDTRPQPVANSNTHLSISVTDPKHSVNIISAQILDMHERVLQELSLKQVSKDFYTTTLPFKAPSERFKVAVVGKVARNGKPIRRIAKISVTPQEPPIVIPPKKPVVSISEGSSTTVEYGKSVKLTCKVSAYPKPVITWTNDHGIIISYQSAVVELPYEYISYMTIAAATQNNKYYCHAVNSLGPQPTTSTISLVVKDPFTVNSVPKATTEIPYSKKGTLKCDIRASVPMHMAWSFVPESGGAGIPIVPSAEYSTSTDGTELSINKMDLDLMGTYSCKAYLDKEPQKSVVYSTKVKIVGLVAPKITTKPSKYTALEGDVALRIPCDAVGVPKPVITWQIGGTVIKPNEHYSISGDALTIVNPKKSDSMSYKCIAKNRLGSVDVTLEAQVHQFFVDYGKTEELNLLKGSSKKLECGSSDTSQSVRWFKNGSELKVKTKYLSLEKVDESHDGKYSCRVSDMRSAYTHTYKVIVGYPPTFTHSHKPIIDWTGDEVFMDCEFKAKPAARVIWTLDGKVLSDQKSSRLIVASNWGRYTCKVSNIHGTEQRSFDVKSTECIIVRNTTRKPSMPLMLTPQLTWPSFAATENYLKIKSGEPVVFTCPDKNNAFSKFSKQKEIAATCDKQDTFIVNGKSYKITDIQCNQEIKPLVTQVRERCLTENSELVRVSFEVDCFLEAYEVCFDISKDIPLYSRVAMSKSNRGKEVTYNWHNEVGIGHRSDDSAYTCKNASSSCCYSKHQLVNAREFNDGPPQRSTFIDPLNAVPYWHSCDADQSSWDDIEKFVRSQLDTFPTFVAWSGTHKLEDRNGHATPRYLWKVLNFDDDDTEDSIAIVYINGPSPSDKDILCKNKCGSEPWMQKHSKHVYCCDIDDFLRAFELGDTTVGESLQEAFERIHARCPGKKPIDV